MFDRIVVPLDGSPLADAALDLAFALCAGPASEIICCHAVDTRNLAAPSVGFAYSFDPATLIDELRLSGEAILAQARSKALAARVGLTTRLLFTDATTAITDLVRDEHADLVIMGTHGRTGLTQMLMGNTADGVLRHCTAPIVTVRSAVARKPGMWPFSRALVAVDDSEPADAAVALALDLAGGHSTRLAFCNVVATADLLGKAAIYGYDPQPLLNELHVAANDLLDGPLSQARAREINADTIVVEGDAFLKITAAATAMNADLIVVGSHGRRGIRRFMLGSVAENIVRTSNVPVMTVRTPLPRAAQRARTIAEPIRA